MLKMDISALVRDKINSNTIADISNDVLKAQIIGALQIIDEARKSV